MRAVDDPAVACTGGATGHACATGATLGEGTNTIACSRPVSSAGQDDVCCFPWTFGPTQCIPQNSFDGANGACPPQSYGFECWSSSPPSLLDPALSCGAPTTSENAGFYFCCTRS